MKQPNTADLGYDQLGAHLEVEYVPGRDFVVFKLGESTVTVPVVHLFSFCFTIAEDPDVQAQLLPVRKTDILQFVRQHEVQLTKDMKAGESVFARCIVDIPLTTIDALKGLVKPVDDEGWANRAASGIVPDEPVPSPVHIERA